jgi:hypothetical protein
MIQLPNPTWKQTNTSDKFGSIVYGKNIDHDETGYISLSPRSVNIFDDAGTVDNVSNPGFDYPVAFGRYDSGDFRLATTDTAFEISISDTGKSIEITNDSSGSSEPSLSIYSHGVWWQNKWHVSTATNIRSQTSTSDWSTDLISNFTNNNRRHYLEVFASRNKLCATDGNTVKQYNDDYTASTTLTIPADYEAVGLAYNNSTMGVITRLGNDSAGQNTEARFYAWNGSSTGAQSDAGVGSIACLGITPYQSTFVVLNSNGQLLKWLGGGFQTLATFPFWTSKTSLNVLTAINTKGNVLSVDGDIIYINFGFNSDGYGKKGEEYLQNNPSGIWCYDPTVGLYHRYSYSNTKVYMHTILEANVNTTTDVFTTSTTIPTTGNPVIMPTATLGGLEVAKIYYVIRLTSTTFKLAETKQDAIDGNWIDITSASVSNILWMYDLVDYGTSYSRNVGAIAQFGDSAKVYRDLLFGASIKDTAMSDTVALCMVVPFLENRGYFVIPKIFKGEQKTNITKITIKHSPLDTGDAIIVKTKMRSYVRIPTVSPNDASSNWLTWTSSTTATTNTDLSEVKEAFDDGEAMELELTAGIGAGQLIKITNITENAGTYTITVEDEVVGYTSGRRSYFVIDNWKYWGSVDVDTQKEGIFELAINDTSKSPQIKIELRGYETKIEDILINDKSLISG